MFYRQRREDDQTVRLRASQLLTERTAEITALMAGSIRSLFKQAAGSLLTKEDRELGPAAINDLVGVVESAKALIEGLERLERSRIAFSKNDRAVANKVVDMVGACRDVEDSDATLKTAETLEKMIDMLRRSVSVFELDEELRAVEPNIVRLVELSDFRKKAGLETPEITNKTAHPNPFGASIPADDFVETVRILKALRREDKLGGPQPTDMTSSLPVAAAPNSSNLDSDFHTEEKKAERLFEATKNVSKPSLPEEDAMQEDSVFESLLGPIFSEDQEYEEPAVLTGGSDLPGDTENWCQHTCHTCGIGIQVKEDPKNLACGITRSDGLYHCDDCWGKK